MKNINILSLVQAHKSLGQESFNRFLQHYGIEIKNAELEDLNSLVGLLCNSVDDLNSLSGFYIGYKIPQISKEFDILRFGNKCVINIELKRTSSEEKIKTQLIRNKYYLSHIGKQIYHLSYVSDTGKLYILNEDEDLEETEIGYLSSLLSIQKADGKEDIDSLFNPSDYLVSPFNSTSKFLDNKYFLTHQQEYVKTKVISSILSANSANFISVVGGAGTGKTLLIYDIVKRLIKIRKKALIIHCGYLNEGQEKLNRCDWNIIPIKNFQSYTLSDYDVIIIDEAQRIYPQQLEKIVESININKSCCIFSYDKIQTLATWEEARDIDGKINKINPLATYKLSEKIRTNKEIADFIRMLFNKKRNLNLSSNGNIEVNYFNNLNDAKYYLESLDSEVWEVLRFTPSQYNSEHHEKYSGQTTKTSHKVIGQEFDCVVVTIDKYFTYSEDGSLIYKGGAYYYPVKMLFQNITRARKRVNLVIIGNEELLNRCLSILK
ncbi:DUF2075 domain-containing protein [Yersinia enterocolitica]